MKKTLLLPAFLMLLFFTACQKEVIETSQQLQGETLTATSNVTALMQRTATNDGSYDNIIDGANCFNVQLPVTVFVNGLETTINTEDDLDIIETIFEEFTNDDDTLDIVFPITIVLSDFTEITIESQSQLQEYIDMCSGENEDDDDIECIDFQYPITFSVFDSNNNQISTITINSDEEMYQFVEDLDESDVASISFPITVVLSDGTEITIDSLSSLEDTIEDAIDQCDEDDDNDWSDDNNNDISHDNFINHLTDCTWTVDKLEINDQDLEEQYQDYAFTFYTNGTLSVENNGTSYNGTWNLVSTDNIQINIQIADLPDFNNAHWILHEIDEDDNEFKFDFRNGEDRLRFVRGDCGVNNQPNCIESDIDTYLLDCVWNVVNLNSSNDLIIYELDFNANQELIITNTTTNAVINATWSTSQSADGVILEFNGVAAADIQVISGNWTITECSHDRLAMTNSTPDEMVIEKDCSNNTNTADLSTIITDGQWVVANYNDSGTDETVNYNGYELTFHADGTVNAVNTSGTISGTWSTTIDNGQLKMILDFGAQTPFDKFNDEWDVFDMQTTRVELRDVSGGNGTVDTLVFEKL